MYYDPTGTLADLGIPEPAEITEAYEMASIVRRLANISASEVLPHTTTTETVVDDMRRYLADRELRGYAQEVNRHFQRHADDLARQIYFKAAPTLIPEICKRAAKPLKVITDAAKHITPDDTAETVLERTKAAADTWRKRAQLDEAASLLRATAHAVQMLGELVKTIPANAPDHPLLWWTDVDDHNHLARLTHEVKGADCPGGMFLALTHAGHDLDLAMPAEYMERVRHIEGTAQAEATRGQRAAREREGERNRQLGERLVAAHERVMVRK
jgi:hypothetical protein